MNAPMRARFEEHNVVGLKPVFRNFPSGKGERAASGASDSDLDILSYFYS